MNIYTVQKPAMTMLGLSVRTNNADEAGPNGRLAGLWEAYFKQNLASAARIRNAHLIYALYTDYERDATGDYTTLIGHEVDPPSLQTEPGLRLAQVPESQYLVFTTKRGPVYEVVAQAWGEIWSYFESSAETRAYTGDFELYDARTFNPADAEVQIYIALK